MRANLEPARDVDPIRRGINRKAVVGEGGPAGVVQGAPRASSNLRRARAMSEREEKATEAGQQWEAKGEAAHKETRPGEAAQA